MAVRIAAVLVSVILHVIATGVSVWSEPTICVLPDPVLEIEVELIVGR